MDICLRTFWGIAFGFEYVTAADCDMIFDEEGHDGAINIDLLFFRLTFIWYKQV